MTSPSSRADEESTALVRQNLRLVALIGRKYANRGVDTTDLFQEGSIGLIKAARRFDHTRGVCFATYATWWIRQGMGRAIAEQGRTVRLPYHVRGAMREVAQTAHDLVGKLGRPADPDEIAARLASSPDRVQRLLDLRGAALSLDAPVGQSAGDTPLIERLVAAGDGGTPEQALEARVRTAAVRAALDSLPARPRALLALRFGIDQEACSLQEAAARLGMNVHRARLIEQRALRRLRHNSTLRTFMAPV